MEKRLCACGCGREIILQRHHKYYGVSKYVWGHNSRTKHPMKGKTYNEIYGRKKAEEIKDAISKKGKGRISPMRGKHHSEETKKRISKARGGSGMTLEELYGKRKRYCACGCGQEIIIKPHHKWNGVPRFVVGHNSSFLAGRTFKDVKELYGKEKKICVCGCEQEIKPKKHHSRYGIPKYIHGHNIKGKSLEERCGKEKADKIKKKISMKVKTKYKKGCAPWNRGLKGNDYLKHFKNGEVWITMEWRNMSEDERYRKIKALRSGNKPTNVEKEMIQIIKKHNLQFVYTGNGKVCFGRKNPDFWNTNGEKICVEIQSVYWHLAINKIEDTPKNRMLHDKRYIDYYKKFGLKCICIWEDELKNENLVLQRLGVK